MAIRNVIGILLKPNGEPIVNGELNFRLQAGYTDDTVNVVLGKTCSTKTDLTGAFSIGLHSGANVTYLCTLPSLERFTFALEENVAALNIVNVR